MTFIPLTPIKPFYTHSPLINVMHLLPSLDICKYLKPVMKHF